MREPQVDTFCRCVKKVKKTLKARPGSTSERGKEDRSAAEGRAIAVCTKSVLQTKGRTIRKVRCRDKVLETQPMKPQEGGDDQTGGKLFAMGADTPVFNKITTDPAQWNGFPVMWTDVGTTDTKKKEKQMQLDALITEYGAVVRMVSAGDGEIPIHRMLKEMIKAKEAPFNSPFVVMHINLWAYNGIYRVSADETQKLVSTLQPAEQDKISKLSRIMGRFGAYKWYGLVTRTQKADVAQLIGRPRIDALCGLLRVLLHIDGRIVHYDLHARNMAIMQDGTPVIHDVGRMKIRDVAASFAPWEVGRPGTWNKRILRNVLMPIFEWPNYNMDYGQYFYIARFFKNLREGLYNGPRPTDDPPRIQFIAEKFPAPTEAGKWERYDISPVNEENKKAFEAWLDQSSGPTGDALPKRTVHINWVKVQTGLRVYDASGTVVDPTAAPGTFFYLDPPTETRYHQIARVFDILSVLKALAWDMKDKNIAFHYARKTAVKIINLLADSPPKATRETVNKTIRDYIKLTGTRDNYDGNTPEFENAWAEKYMGVVNDARSGKKYSAMSAAEKAAQDARIALEAAEEAAAADAAADAAAAAADAEAAKAKMAAAKKAAEDAEAAVVAARAAAAAAGAEASEAVEDVGAPPPPDALNNAVDSEAIIAELNAMAVPAHMALDEAVADASEILRESENADNSEVLIEKGMTLSPADVEAEAKADAPATSPEAPPIKRLSAEDKELAAALEDARLAQGSSPDTGVTYEVGTDGKAVAVPPPPGGRMKGGAAGTSAVAIPIKSWDECPPGAGQQPAITVAKAEVGDNPSKIVLYIGHPGAKEKQDIVKASDAYKPYALTYISAYDAESIPVKLAAKGYRWDRPSRGARLQRIGVNFSTFKEQSVVKSLVGEFGPEIPCLLIPKFQKTVVEAGVGEGVNAMFDILKGLCVARNFVIDDLHIGNMAIFNGKGVTFDYDRLCEKDPTYELFKGKLQEIHDFSEQYAGLPQFTPAFRLYDDITKEPALVARYFCIYDLLSVLASLKELTRAAGGLSAVEECELALKGSAGDTFEGRTAAVSALVATLKDVVWPEMSVVDVFDGKPVPKSTGPMRREPGSLARANASPAGGHRTPRRKGLPQLL